MDFAKIFLWGGLAPALVLFAGLCAAWLIVFIGRRAGEGDSLSCPRCGQPRVGAERRARCTVCGASGPKRVRRHSPHWALALLLAIGFVPAYYGLHGTLELWPVETAKRYVHVGAAAAVVGVIEGFIALPMVAVVLLRFGACGFASWALLEGLRASGRFDETGLWLTVGLTGIGGVVASLLVDAASRRLALVFVAFALAAGAAVVSGTLMQVAFYADSARLTGAVIAMLSALACFSLLWRDVRLDRGGSVVIVSLLVSLLVGGRWLGGTWASDGWVPGLPWVSLMLLILAPGGVAVVRLPWLSRRGRLIRGVAALAAVVGVSGAGGLTAWLLTPAAPAQAEDPYADFLDDP